MLFELLHFILRDYLEPKEKKKLRDYLFNMFFVKILIN